MITRTICDSHFAISMPSKLIYFLRSHHFLFLKINFDGSVWDQCDFGGSEFVIESGTSIFVATGYVRIFNTTISMAMLHIAGRFEIHYVYELQKFC